MQIPRPSVGSRHFLTAGQDVAGTWRRYATEPRSRLILSILGVLGLLALVWFLSSRGGSTNERRLPPPPVLVARVMERNVVVQEPAIGTILANATVQLTAQVAGRLFSAEFREGQIVHRGDVLFRIDPRPFQAALQQAAATLGRDRAQLVAAQNDKLRYASLFAQKAVSAQQRDQAAATANALAATIRADQAMVAIAQLNLDYAVIRSPIDGKTGPILVQPGNLVSAASGATASPLVVITQIQPVKVSFALPQSDLPRVQKQAADHRLIATVEVHGAPQTTRKAPVDFISNAVDGKTGTIELRATFPNEDGVLVPGQLVDVSVSLAELPHVPVVPSNAVNEGPNGRYVYALDRAGNAVMRPVTVLNDDGRLAALKGAVKVGETVITDGQMLVRPGKPVMVKGGGHEAHRRKP